MPLVRSMAPPGAGRRSARHDHGRTRPAGKPIWRRKQMFGLLQPIGAVGLALGFV